MKTAKRLWRLVGLLAACVMTLALWPPDGRGQDAPPPEKKTPAPGAEPGTNGGTDSAPDSPEAKAPDDRHAPAPDLEENPQHVLELEEIVVTASRREARAFDAPRGVAALDGEYIRGERQARTLPEALFETTGVMVQKTSHGQGSPFIRGFTGFRTLLMVDGVRLNNSVFREGPCQYWNTVDALSLSRIEIVRGPSSVLYGSDAVGGTVNAFTVEPDLGEEGARLRRRLFARYSSAEDSFVGREETMFGVDGRLGMLLGFSVKDFGDVRAGEHVGLQHKTGYEETCGDFKLVYLIEPETQLTVAYQHVDQDDAWRTHRTVHAESWRATTIGTDHRLDFDQNRTLGYAALRLDDADAFFQKARFCLSVHEQTEDQFRIDPNRRRTYQGFDVDTYGVGSQFESATPIGTLTYGIDYYRDRVNSYRKDPDRAPTVADPNIQGAPRGPVADGATYDLLGVFLQDEFGIGEKLDVTLGCRYTDAKADADEVGLGDIGTNSMEVLPDLSESYDAVVGSLGMVCHITDELNAYCSVSQGFRAPNISDLTSFDISRTGELETPATDLEPEEFLSYEIGLKALGESTSAEVAFFYTDIKDMLVRVPTGNVVDGSNEVTRHNLGDGYVQGVELAVTQDLCAGWQAHARFAWQEGELDTYPTAQPVEKREPMSRILPATATIGLRYTEPEEDFWVEGLVTIADNQDRLSPDDKRDTQRIPPGGTPGYTVYTLRGGVNLWEDADLSVSVENITNKDYRVLGSGQNEPGTNFIVSFDVGF
ncbi:MAG: TonB-dependent receptor [Planctomycetota bacterium]|nr:TonB-dependent receptor [Planctomycetota bacterium]